MTTIAADAAQTTPRSGWALAALSLSTLLASLGTSSANVALPALKLAFAAPFASVQWVVLAYLLAITTLVVSAGKLGDLVGRRRLLLAGLGLFTGASLLCSLAPSLLLLIAARAVQGTGAAAMMALTLALVAGAVPKEKAGSAMGLLGTMSAVGTALGPSLGGALLEHVGWPAIFLANVPLGIATIWLCRRFLPQDARPADSARAPFDHPGTLLLAITLGAYALAMTTRQFMLLVGSAAALGMFLLLEKRTVAPLIPLALFRDRALCGGFIMSALVTTVIMATLVVGPFYLTGALGLSAAAAGLAMSCGPAVSALTGIPAGRLVDRFGSRSVVVGGLWTMLAGCVLLAQLPAAAGVAGYIGALALLTAGYAMFQAANNTGVMQQIDARQKGVASGMLNLARNLGLISGASLMGMIFGLGTTAAAGMRLTFAWAAALAAAALIVALAGGKRGGKAR